MRSLLFGIALVCIASPASARNVEAGELWVTGGPGAGFKMGSPLGGSAGYLMLMAQGEYTLSSSLGIVAGLNYGLAGTMPLRLRAGGRYRIADLDLPVVPWAQAQLSVGRLFDVIGANLTTLGVHLGGGADYFLTASLAVGGMIGVELSSTLGERPAFYGTFEIMALASWSFGAPAAAPTEAPEAAPAAPAAPPPAAGG